MTPLQNTHLANLHYRVPPETTQFAVRMTVVKSLPETFFVAICWSGGYFGFKERDGQRYLCVSVWDAASQFSDGKTRARAVPAKLRAKIVGRPNGAITRFDGEGTGLKWQLRYPWKERAPYYFTVAKVGHEYLASLHNEQYGASVGVLIHRPNVQVGLGAVSTFIEDIHSGATGLREVQLAVSQPCKYWFTQAEGRGPSSLEYRDGAYTLRAETEAAQ